jgi:hypothetical protein
VIVSHIICELIIINIGIRMSLFVIGSVSRVASNLINNLSKHGIYSQITIGDPLPHYDYHNRYYRLQK